ncbi:MAG: Mur ligase family protein, partial [Rhodospirillaceae bacterium]|nr:Mur ligase family protein [Rhodospirillaceae bacterium]
MDDWLRWLETLHPKKIDLGLERIRQVLAALALQAPAYRIVTVGGTNGKGSCVALLEAIYRAAGLRVGAFTSPHLWRFNERIRLDGAEVAALLHFARHGTDVALLEVGLGGRLDAVNAVDADASLIVSIDLDHQTWLGTTREAIGYEKAGIMRPARPAVIADRNPPASVLAHARRVGAAVERMGREFDYGPVDATWAFRGRQGPRRGLPRPAFGGEEQLANAAGCLALIDALSGLLPVAEDALVRGLRSARLNGRSERREIGGVTWVFDVAHNPAAAAALARTLAGDPVAGRTRCVVAIMGDKDHRGVLAPMLPVVDEWLLTRSAEARGAPPALLAEALGEQAPATVCFDIRAAC